jgi:hypothetical protein
MVWIKNRDTTDSHCLFDSVRTATEVIHSDATTAETTDADTLTSFDSDGFTLGADVKVNTDTEKYVAWCWKANGSGSANTDGSATSTVSVNTTAGFSICKFNLGDSGAVNFGHGLGVAPSMVIMKPYSGVSSWGVYHKSVGAGKYLLLNNTEAEASSSTVWGNTTPSTSLVYTNHNDFGADVDTIAYCFADKQGFSKVGGSYTGNGNADGTFVYTGFRPAWVMIKQSSTSGAGWRIHDTKRGISGNPEDETLYTSAIYGGGSNAESTGRDVDFLSNGFKLRTDSGDGNSSDETYIYMAFAEAPFVNSNGVPCNAR